MDPNTDLDDDVLESAAALIDDVYAFSSGSEVTSDHEHVSSRRVRVREEHRTKVARLESQIAELEQNLRDTYNDRYGNDFMAQLWEDIATDESAELEEAVTTNARLKNVAREQLSDSQKIKELLAESLELTQTSRLCEPVATANDQEQIDTSHLEASLRLRLRRTDFARDPAWTCPRASVGSPFWDRESHCDDLGRRLIIRNRYAAYFPFKMSVVVRAFWNLINERNVETEGYSEHESEVSRPISSLIEEAYGRAESRGVGVFRREYRPDGSVHFTWGSITMPPSNDMDASTNLLVGLVAHETGWGRATRINSSRQQSLIYFEHVALKEIHPTTDGDKMVQLKHLEEFLRRVSISHNPTGWQRLENAALDASSSRKFRS